MLGETVDTFIIALHTLAEHYNYGSLKEELIRDRIVIGMSDIKTRLQSQSNLTLDEAILAVRQAEMQSTSTSNSRDQFQSSSNKCQFCGLQKHPRCCR